MRSTVLLVLWVSLIAAWYVVPAFATVPVWLVLLPLFAVGAALSVVMFGFLGVCVLFVIGAVLS